MVQISQMFVLNMAECFSTNKNKTFNNKKQNSLEINQRTFLMGIFGELQKFKIYEPINNQQKNLYTNIYCLSWF